MIKLGLKPCKALGNVKSKKEMNNLLVYLQIGKLPEDYIQKLNALISD